MFKIKAALLVSIFLLTAFVGPAKAVSITDVIGDQDFTDGSIVPLTDFLAASGGDPAYFNSVSGSDPGGTFGNISYSHNFLLGGATPTTASLTLGLYDHDALGAGEDTINIFFDGIQQNDDVWKGISTDNRGYYIRSMDVATSLLLDGILNVQVVGTPISGEPGNFIGIDFSSLAIQTSAVPVPAAVWLFGTGLLALFGFSNRKSSGPA